MGNSEQKQEQVFKQNSEQDFTLAQKQKMYEEMHYKLFAEIEILFLLEGIQVCSDYQKCRESKDMTHSAVIANIENFLLAIQNFNMLAQLTNQPLKLPFPSNWNLDALARYYHSIPKEKVSKDVLYHCLKGSQEGSLSGFPPELAEKVLSTAKRTAMRNEFTSNPANVAHFMYGVHKKQEAIPQTYPRDGSNQQTPSWGQPEYHVQRPVSFR